MTGFRGKKLSTEGIGRTGESGSSNRRTLHFGFCSDSGAVCSIGIGETLREEGTDPVGVPPGPRKGIGEGIGMVRFFAASGGGERLMGTGRLFLGSWRVPVGVSVCTCSSLKTLFAGLGEGGWYSGASTNAKDVVVLQAGGTFREVLSGATARHVSAESGDATPGEASICSDRAGSRHVSAESVDAARGSDGDGSWHFSAGSGDAARASGGVGSRHVSAESGDAGRCSGGDGSRQVSAESGDAARNSKRSQRSVAIGAKRAFNSGVIPTFMSTETTLCGVSGLSGDISPGQTGVDMSPTFGVADRAKGRQIDPNSPKSLPREVGIPLEKSTGCSILGGGATDELVEGRR